MIYSDFALLKMSLAAFFFLVPTTAEEVQLSKGAKVLFYLQLLKNVFTLIGRSLSFPSIRFTSSFSPEKKKKRVSSFSISLFFFFISAPILTFLVLLCQLFFFSSFD